MSIKVERLVHRQLDQNCYLVTKGDEGECVVIDPGFSTEKVTKRVKDIKLRYILLTHGHFDHISGAESLREATGAIVVAHVQEAPLLADPEKNLSAFNPGVDALSLKADELVEEGHTLSWGDCPLEVIHVPGHTPGSVAYRCGSNLFVGDAVFAGGIGRTDLPGGDRKVLMNSITGKILTLPDDTSLYPGHGPDTTVAIEKESNPFLN